MTTLEKINSIYINNFLIIPFVVTKENYTKSEIKKIIKSLSPSNSRYNEQFWIFRGYSQTEAKHKVNLIKQTEKSEKRKKLP